MAGLSLVLKQAVPQQLSLPAFFERDTVDQVFPLNLWASVQRAQAQERRRPMTTSINGSARAGTADEPLHLVLVIGETVRPDHLGIYGYARDTTPGLSALRDELLLFRDVASTAHWTEAAVPGIVGRKLDDRREAGLVRTLREAGYHTAWLSNQETLQPRARRPRGRLRQGLLRTAAAARQRAAAALQRAVAPGRAATVRCAAHDRQPFPLRGRATTRRRAASRRRWPMLASAAARRRSSKPRRSTPSTTPSWRWTASSCASSRRCATTRSPRCWSTRRTTARTSSTTSASASCMR